MAGSKHTSLFHLLYCAGASCITLFSKDPQNYKENVPCTTVASIGSPKGPLEAWAVQPEERGTLIFPASSAWKEATTLTLSHTVFILGKYLFQSKNIQSYPSILSRSERCEVGFSMRGRTVRQFKDAPFFSAPAEQKYLSDSWLPVCGPWFRL